MQKQIPPAKIEEAGAPASSAGGDANAQPWLRRAWHQLPIRWQILTTISIVALLASLLSGVFAVYDARSRADIETQANIELWANHITSKVRSVTSPSALQEFADALDVEMAGVRHVSVSIRDAAGLGIDPLQHRPEKQEDFESRAPDWFVDLVQPDIESRIVDITAGAGSIGSVLISGVPDDEIAEAWELLKLLALLWLAAVALMMVGLYFILGLILDPLARLGSGMRELEVGHFAFRLDKPQVRELEPIAAAFNGLATALGRANAENSRLYRQLIAVQEQERREISRDLHDEFGPSLFAIMAGMSAVTHHAKTLPASQAAPILACVDEIVQISEHLKSLNRGLLNRLRPVALGRRTISELIAELIATFQRRHKTIVFEFAIGDLPSTFGEGIDLTVYRCVQEGVTNAIRHGRARRITIEISPNPEPTAIELRITDDGTGVVQGQTFGYGLSSMRERVHEFAGTLRIAPAEPRGTALAIDIPLTEDSAATPDEAPPS